MERNIQSHKDLKVWQESINLVLKVYEITTSFPHDEKFILTQQLKRAVVSVPSNIAEGFARKGNKELVQFLYVALGSLTEVETQLEISLRLKYISDITDLENQIKFIRVMLSSLIKSIKSKTP